MLTPRSAGDMPMHERMKEVRFDLSLTMETTFALASSASFADAFVPVKAQYATRQHTGVSLGTLL